MSQLAAGQEISAVGVFVADALCRFEPSRMCIENTIWGAFFFSKCSCSSLYCSAPQLTSIYRPPVVCLHLSKDHLYLMFSDVANSRGGDRLRATDFPFFLFPVCIIYNYLMEAHKHFYTQSLVCRDSTRFI